MKHWKVDYSIRYAMGIDEESIIVEAETINEALRLAEGLIKDVPGEEVVIWDVGIMEDDVF